MDCIHNVFVDNNNRVIFFDSTNQLKVAHYIPPKNNNKRYHPVLKRSHDYILAQCNPKETMQGDYLKIDKYKSILIFKKNPTELLIFDLNNSHRICLKNSISIVPEIDIDFGSSSRSRNMDYDQCMIADFDIYLTGIIVIDNTGLVRFYHDKDVYEEHRILPRKSKPKKSLKIYLIN